jgi:cytochrome c peroxidase
MKLFYGKAGCSECHSGPLQTDHGYHAVAMPQIGPGKGDFENGDFGREQVTHDIDTDGDGVPQDDADRYKFRTPSLRNTALTGPWGHGGAYNSLEAMVRHQLDPVTSLHDYDIGEAVLPSRTDLDAEDFVHMSDPDNVQAIADASEIQESIALSETEVAELIAFLHALTDPASLDLRTTVPISVPSGLRLAD